MMAVVDSVTGMVYWVPAEYQAPMQPRFAPVVMPYRFLRPIAPAMAPAQPTTSGPVVNTTVFVRGVPRESTTQTVETHFKIYGDIVSCHVIRHKDASTNKGIAFVKFHDHAAAQRAIDCNNPGVMDQREIFAEWAHPKRTTTSASRPVPVPDQPIALEYMPRPNAPEYIPRPNAPHLYLAPPATHLINSPSFFPAPSPVMPAITYSNAHLPWMVTPGASSSSMVPYGSYNPSFIHVVGFPHPDNFSGSAYGQEISLARSPNYFPVVDYNPGGASAPAVSSEEETPSPSFVAEESTSQSRKGKESSDDS
ncbi:hypothetical protein M758_3G237000 [Ceratodon purpureus]|uniref:RRM domain-containing protein n=1 Tax=Ceratodon purpureus TaxID=3225 RepID=A0A8T0INP3_CERPU|nr:hypothetical protein KC19_3G235400 [Ceratodon purpureus]KAG0624288.1 hypothetical protein M758_3G237000 [Ceratodon purpureus]